MYIIDKQIKSLNRRIGVGSLELLGHDGSDLLVGFADKVLMRPHSFNFVGLFDHYTFRRDYAELDRLARPGIPISQNSHALF